MKRDHTEKEQINTHRKSVFLIDLLSKNEEVTFQDIADLIPGIFHVNDGKTLEIKLMATSASRVVELSGEEIVGMGLDFFDKYIAPETIQQVFPNFQKHYNHGDLTSIYTDVQLYRPTSTSDEFLPLLTSTKIDPSGKNLLTSTIPFKELSKSIRALERVIDLRAFSQLHFERFQTLTKREKQILTLIAQGWSNQNIGDLLYISKDTVRTHRNRIWRKLDLKHFKDALEYAQAFNLV